MKTLTIENEMKLLHAMQMSGEMENDSKIYFEADDTWVSIHSEENFLIALGLPNERNNYVYIRMLYVPENLRTKRIGSIVVGSVISQARSKKLSSVQIESTPESLPFWEKMGFISIGEKNRMIYNLSV